MKLVKIIIKNCLSINDDVSITIDNHLTTLIGVNGSGKSNILNVIKLLNGDKINVDYKNLNSKDFDSEIRAEFKIKKEECEIINKINDKLIARLPENDIKFSNYIINSSGKNTKDYKINLMEKTDKSHKDIMLNNLKSYLDSQHDIKKDVADEIIKYVDSINIDYPKKYNEFIKKFENEPFYNQLVFLTQEMTYFDKSKYYELFPKYKFVLFDSTKELIQNEVQLNLKHPFFDNLLKIANVDFDFIQEKTKQNNESSYKILRKIWDMVAIKINSAYDELTNSSDEKFKFSIDFMPFPINKIALLAEDISIHNRELISKLNDGKKWLLSLCINMLANMKKPNESIDNYIFLFDEPDTHLHPIAQHNLLEYLFNDKLLDYQIIYSTHSPFIIDNTRPSSYRLIVNNGRTLCYNEPKEYCIETKKMDINDQYLPVLYALDINLTNGLLLDKSHKIIVFEGTTDVLLMQGVVEYFNDDRFKNYSYVSAGNADKVNKMFRFIYGLGYNVFAVLDNDDSGRTAYKKLAFEDGNETIYKNKIMFVNGKVDSNTNFVIEKLFSETDYKKFGISNKNQIFRSELKTKLINKTIKFDSVSENNIKEFLDRIYRQCNS